MRKSTLDFFNQAPRLQLNSFAAGMNPTINSVVPDFERSFEVKRSTKSLTTPVSPKFLTDLRARGLAAGR
jgi:hypothetical protein